MSYYMVWIDPTPAPITREGIEGEVPHPARHPTRRTPFTGLWGLAEALGNTRLVHLDDVEHGLAVIVEDDAP